MADDRRRGARPADEKREDSSKFLYELSGLPVRSIGSQIAITPSVPQPSSPLASVGKPPTHSVEESAPSAADAVTQIDVIAGMIANADGQEVIDESMEWETEPVDASGDGADTLAASQASDEVPDDFKISEGPEEVEDWARYSGDLDMEVIEAGGTPMMSRRTDLTHEQRMAIATEGNVQSPRQEKLAKARSERLANESMSRADRREIHSGVTEGQQRPPGAKAGEVTGKQADTEANDSVPPVSASGQTFTSAQQAMGHAWGANGGAEVPPGSRVGGGGEGGGDQDFLQGDSPFIKPLAMANSAIDQYSGVIQMVIECLEKLSVASTSHQAKLATILDRLDSVSGTDEYGEEGSEWLG